MTNAFRILIADDDDDDVFFFRQAISEMNVACHVESFQNGSLLLDHLSSSKTLPSLIILDLNMPRMNGFEVLEKLKEDERLKPIPAYILTTSQNESDIKKCTELGSDGFYTKPLEYSGYTTIIENILTRVTF